MKKSLYLVIFLALLASASGVTAQIQLTFSSVQPSCHGYTNGTATVLAVGGTGAYSYAWTNGQTTETNFGIGAGLYTVTVTDENSNTASGSVSVDEPSALAVLISANALGCDGSSGTLTATGSGGTTPYSYNWDGPNSSSSETVAVTGPGNYFATVTDGNGCSTVGSFTVASALMVDVVATDIPCSIYPDGGAANAIVNGGEPPYTFSWSNGETTQIITGISAGTYTCTVTSTNGCTAIGSDVVDIPSPLEVEIISLTPACGGNNNGAATVEASGGTPPYLYSWTSGPNGPLPVPLDGPTQTGLAPGQYYVCTFDANHCQKDRWVIIPATDGLDVTLEVKSATCVGINNAAATAIVSPPGNGYLYDWTLILDNVVTHISGTIQLTGLAAGTKVTVVVTDPISGCTGTASGIVGAHNNLNIAVTDIDITCAGGFGSATAVASNGTPQYVYTWFSNGVQIGNQASIAGLNPGAYLVSVVDSAGCKAQSVADIGIQSAPHASIAAAHVLVCGDSLSTVQFTNTSSDPYNQITGLVWTVKGPTIDSVIVQQNQITFQLPVDETITVQLIATSGLGCPDTVSIIYNVPGFPNISISLDSSSINCTGDPVAINVINGDSSYTYVWTPMVTLNPNPLHVLVNPTVVTTYMLVVTDGNACTTSASITVAPTDSLFQLSVSDQLIVTCSDSAVLFASTSIPATIVWSQGNTIYTGNPITVPATPTATIYTVKALTADGCFRSEQVSVTGNAIHVSLSPNADQRICERDTLPLWVVVSPASDSYHYDWSVTAPGVLSSTTSSTPWMTGPSGSYTVKVIVSNEFCSDTLSFVVEIIPAINIAANISVNLCDGLHVQFFNSSGIDGEWNFGDGSANSAETNPIHTYASADQYPVVFTSNLECTLPWDSLIQVQEFALSASIIDSFVQCTAQAEIQFFGIVNNASSSVSHWNWVFAGGTPPTANIQNPVVTYTQEGPVQALLIVQDINGCRDTVSTTVQVHFISDTIPNAVSICLGDSVQLNPGGHDLGANYVWTSTPFDATLDPNDPTPIVSPSVPTTYSVQVSEGLCSELYTVSLTLSPGSEVHLPSDTTMIVCTNQLVTITAQGSGAAGYEWSNSPNFTNIIATTQTVQVMPNATYYVRTTGTVCTAVDSMTIDLGVPEIQVVPTDNDICQGEQTALILTNLITSQNLHYQWDPALPDVANPIISPAESTVYFVTVTNQYGCTTTLSLSVNVTTVGVTAVAEPDTVSAQNPTTILTATGSGNSTITSYSWSPAGTLSNPGAAQTQATPNETETYFVTVTNAQGCTAIDTVMVHYRSSPCVSPNVFIPNAFSPNNDQKNDYFMVKADGMTKLKFIVWNRWGELVFETDDPNAQGWDGTYRGKELNPDSFAWYVLLTCGNGDVFQSKGNVTLLK